MVDPDKRWHVFGERCAQPLPDPTSGPVFSWARGRSYLGRQCTSIRHIDSQTRKTRCGHLSAGVVNADVAVKDGTGSSLCFGQD